MTWLSYWFGIATGFPLGVVWCIAMWFVFYRRRRIKMPRGTIVSTQLLANVIEGDGRARWPWRRP